MMLALDRPKHQSGTSWLPGDLVESAKVSLAFATSQAQWSSGSSTGRKAE
jgi:hypothetical protein